MSTGYDRTLVYAAETTWGTAVTPSRPVPFKADGDGLVATYGRLDSDAFYAGSVVESSNQWSAGNIDVTGPLKFELYDRAITKWFVNAIGTVSSTTASNPYTHTITPSAITSSLTVQIGRPGSSGTVQPFTYAGVKINKWTLHAEVGQIANVTFETICKSETTATALVSVTSGSYTSGIKAMTYVGGSVLVGGTASGVNVQSFDLSGDNKLTSTERRFVGSQTISEPLDGGSTHDYGGTLNCEFYDLAQYNRLSQASEFAVVLTLIQGTSQLVATCNARYDGAVPTLSASWPQVVALPFKCVRSTTADSTALSLAFTTPDATP